MSVLSSLRPGVEASGPEAFTEHDSGAGDGHFRTGLVGTVIPSITRKTDKGLPRYLDGTMAADLLSGAEDFGSRGSTLRASGCSQTGCGLLTGLPRSPLPASRQAFRPYRMLARCGDSTNVFWRGISRDSVHCYYCVYYCVCGMWIDSRDPDSRVDPDDPLTHIFQWMLYEPTRQRAMSPICQYQREDGAGVERSQLFGSQPTCSHRARRHYRRIACHGWPECTLARAVAVAPAANELGQSAGPA